MDDSPPEEELLKKLQVLEECHAHLKQELSTLSRTTTPIPMPNRKTKELRQFCCCTQDSLQTDESVLSSASRLPATLKFIDPQHVNILQSAGQAVHVIDLNCLIIFWNAGNLFGYSVAEVLGQISLELLTDPQSLVVARRMLQRLNMGESWTGQFPVRNKMGKTFTVITTNTPFYDDNGAFIGIICVSSHIQPFQEERVPLLGVDELPEPDSSFDVHPTATQLGFSTPQQPLENAITSRFTNLATKVSSTVKSGFIAGNKSWDYKAGSGDRSQSDHSGNVSLSNASSPRGDLPPPPLALFSKIKDKFHI